MLTSSPTSATQSSYSSSSFASSAHSASISSLCANRRNELAGSFDYKQRGRADLSSSISYIASFALPGPDSGSPNSPWQSC